MTSPTSDQWERDHAADANLDLTRKRQRLSQEPESSPLTSPESVIIEVLAPEEVGASFATAIEVNDDPTMETYSASFQLWPESTPIQQLENLYRLLTSGYYIHSEVITSFTLWLEKHLLETKDDDSCSWITTYPEDHDFFFNLGKVMCALLDRSNDLFETRDIHQVGIETLRGVTTQLYLSFIELSSRILLYLPKFVDRTLQRRDSVQSRAPPQSVDLLWYMLVLSRTTGPRDPPVMTTLHKTLGISPRALLKESRTFSSRHPSAVLSFVELFKILSRSHREIALSWETIDAMLPMATIPELGFCTEMKSLLETAHGQLLPILCGKHPKALPELFHENFVAIVADWIRNMSIESDEAGSKALYENYIRTGEDILLTESLGWDSIIELTGTTIERKQKLLPELVSAAWTLHTLKSFIFSDIMDVRSCGISLLSTRLSSLYNTYKDDGDIPEHPILQYAARFLRSSELTKYIFGPNSHASLVNHSQHIFSFLAATLAHDDLETDIIWHACTNSVEAEFVKASFRVLTDLYPFLEIDRLLYIGKNFAITSPSKLVRDAANSLAVLFQNLQVRTDRSHHPRHRLATAFISIDIMMRVDESPESPSSRYIRKVAKNELSRFAQAPFVATDRDQIYARCVPNVVDRTQHATTSVEILAMFLRDIDATHESESLLGMLPVSAAVEEFTQYIQSASKPSAFVVNVDRSAIASRLEVAIRLIALPAAKYSEETVQLLYTYAFGERGLNNAARDTAWHILNSMAASEDVGIVALNLLNDFIKAKALTLAPEFVTLMLVELLRNTLFQYMESNIIQEDYSQILKIPTWQKLVETAESSTTPSVRKLATDMICDILFQFPAQHREFQLVKQCHTAFTHQQLGHLYNQYENSTEHDEVAKRRQILDRIDLLDAVLRKSRETWLFFEQGKHSELRLGNHISYTLQIYGTHAHPKIINLRADESTKVSELVAHLHEFTGTSENRIFSGGRAIDLTTEADHALSEIGIQASGVILISPRHSLESDISKISIVAGSVEQELLHWYDRLGKLLDGAEDVSYKTFLFITKISPPTRVRALVSSPETPTSDLFPPIQLWRSVFTVFVLRKHYEDFVHLGVANEGFLVRGIHLLVTALTDTERPLRPEFHIRALECLIQFLLEQPQTSEISCPIENPSKFVSCMIELCLNVVQSNMEISLRRRLVHCIFRTLFHSFRRQHSVWMRFTEHESVVQLHKLVLTDQDTDLNANTANTLKLFCPDTNAATETAEFYTKTLLAVLPFALERRDRAMHFFDAITQVLLANRAFSSNESRVRELTLSLICKLWEYEHTESVDLPMVDVAFLGLLNLLHEVITILRSFKKPLQLQHFSAQIFTRLLFPDTYDSTTRPLVDQRTRQIAFNLMQATCEMKNEYARLLYGTYATIREACLHPYPKYQNYPQRTRPAWKCSGLTNLGMTCYMNALLQQFFANTQFRKFILDTPVVNDRQQFVLLQVQRLFAHMQNDYSCFAETQDLAEALGIQIENQEDVHGFYEDFISRLEACMPDATFRTTLGKFFGGKLVSQIKGECGHVSPKIEPFLDLPIIVKNKASLQESLEEFVQGEPMEGANRYKCLACDPTGGGRLVNAMKRACLEEIPDNLTFCLKRFTFEAMLGLDGKVNDRFEFPETIDMSQYHRAHLDNSDAMVEEDLFELVGVIVHQGTLHLGHYWSYVLTRGSNSPRNCSWMRVEDKKVTHCRDGIDEVQRECFGGQIFKDGSERSDNAYVLFYQRKKSLVDETLNKVVAQVSGNHPPFPPKVPLPPTMEAQLHQSNVWHQRAVHLFDRDFALHVAWLLSSYRKYSPPSPEGENCEQLTNPSPPQGEEESSDSEPEESTLDQLLEVAMTYSLSSLTVDNNSMQHLDPILTALANLLPDFEQVARHCLSIFLEQPVYFSNLFAHGNKDTLNRMSEFILRCTVCLKEQDYAAYLGVFERITQLHASFLGVMPELSRFEWSTYLHFILMLAQDGPGQTALILDKGYLTWAFDMIDIPWSTHLKKRNPGVCDYLKNSSHQVTAIYDFVHGVLKGPVDISKPGEHGPNETTHVVTDSGVLLLPCEFLRLTKKLDGVFSWMLSARHADANYEWRDFAPAKLISLLMPLQGPMEVAQQIELSLRKYIDKEEQVLTPVVFLTLQFCANCKNDQDAMSVFNAVAHAIRQWDASEEEFLYLVVEAYHLVPWTTIQSLTIWYKLFLLCQIPKIREKTETWLREVVLQPKPISDAPDLDACRARQVRKIVDDSCKTLRRAYDLEEPRNRYENLVNIMQNAESYLKELKTAVAAILQGEGNDDAAAPEMTLSAALLAEYREIPSALSSLRDLLEFLSEWESDTAIEEVRDTVRASIELMSEDAESSEEEEMEEER